MKHRIAAVSYVNTLPFITGLQSPEIKDDIEVILAHPARCAELLERGEVDIALCPVGALPVLGQYYVITDYCIGCDGEVRTVSVYSNEPLDKVNQIVLSAESRTSNILVQMINRDYWKYDIRFAKGAPAFPVSPGFLHIGDICFQKEREFTNRTDLGKAWKEWTGLPFAFACWVSKKEIPSYFIEKLNAVFEKGTGNIDEISFPNALDPEMMREYLRKNISYGFDEKKKEAMGMFLDKVSSSKFEV